MPCHGLWTTSTLLLPRPKDGPTRLIRAWHAQTVKLLLFPAANRLWLLGLCSRFSSTLHATPFCRTVSNRHEHVQERSTQAYNDNRKAIWEVLFVRSSISGRSLVTKQLKDSHDKTADRSHVGPRSNKKPKSIRNRTKRAISKYDS